MRDYLQMILISVFCLFIFQHNIAQSWKRLSQSPLGLSYEVPRNWFVGGIMDENKCNCESGTLNSSLKDQTNMVIFAAKEISLDSLKRQTLEGYHFLETDFLARIKTDFFDFEQHTSYWKEDNTLQVIRLTTTQENRHYLIYFWGERNALLNQKENINRIINSIRPAAARAEIAAPTLVAPKK
jgi:hypothetical protein